MFTKTIYQSFRKSIVKFFIYKKIDANVVLVIVFKMYKRILERIVDAGKTKR